MRYVVGDVHGNLELLRKFQQQINSNDKMIFVGDLIDRGNNSKEVIDFVIENEYEMVLGNHELMLLGYDFLIDFLPFLENSTDSDFHNRSFMLNGGENTLRSYGAIIEQIPTAYSGYMKKFDFDKFDDKKFKEHIDFLKKQPFVITYEDTKTIISHSSLYDNEYNLYDELFLTMKIEEFKDKLKFFTKKDFNTFQDEIIHLEEIITWNRKILSYSFGEKKENVIPNGYKNLFGHTGFEYIIDRKPEYKKLNGHTYIPIDYGAGYNKLLCGYCLETNEKLFVDFDNSKKIKNMI